MNEVTEERKNGKSKRNGTDGQNEMKTNLKLMFNEFVASEISYVNHVEFFPQISSMRHALYPNSYSAAPNYLRSLAYS